MKTIYGKLNINQISEDIIYTSTLSMHTTEQPEDTIHIVLDTDEDKDRTINRLKNVTFFKNSPWKYHIIRTL